MGGTLRVFPRFFEREQVMPFAARSPKAPGRGAGYRRLILKLIGGSLVMVLFLLAWGQAPAAEQDFWMLRPQGWESRTQGLSGDLVRQY